MTEAHQHPSQRCWSWAPKQSTELFLVQGQQTAVGTMKMTTLKMPSGLHTLSLCTEMLQAVYYSGLSPFWGRQEGGQRPALQQRERGHGMEGKRDWRLFCATPSE